MIFYTENFKKYSKLINVISVKGNQVWESIYLNFQDSHAYLHSSKGNLKFPFLWEKDKEDEIPVNFFVTADKFIILCQSYENFTLLSTNEKRVILQGKDEFEITTFLDDSLVSFSDLFEEADNENKYIDFQDVNLEHLSNSLSYADANESSLNGIFIRDNRLIATDKQVLYEATLNSNLPDMQIPLFLAKIIHSMEISNFSLFHTSRIFCVKWENLTLVLPINVELNIPDVRSEKFINSYSHETYVLVDRKKIISAINFLDPFLKDIINNVLHISIQDNNLVLQVKDGSKIKKVVELDYVNSELNNVSMCLSLSHLKKSLNHNSLPITKIQIPVEMDGNSNIINISSQGKDGQTQDRHSIIVLFKNK